MKMFMTIGSVILFLMGGVLLLFSVLFMLAAFSPDQADSLLGVGLLMAFIAVVCIGGGIALVFAARRQAAAASGTGDVSYNIDLPGKVNLDTMKCSSCGGVLSSDNIDMAAGAPVVHCPFCGTSYQLTEEPKW